MEWLRRYDSISLRSSSTTKKYTVSRIHARSRMYPSSGAWDILPLEKGFAITAKLLIMIEGCVLKRLRCLLV